jgi:transposase
LLLVSQPLIELVEQRLGRLRDHGARGKDRLGAGTLELVVVLRRHHASDHDHDVVAALLDEGGLELRNEREMRRCERRHAEHVNVVLDGLARGLRWGRKQRTDVDIEAEIGEGGRDHLLSAVMTVLADLGHQDARPAAFIGFELSDELLHPRNRFRHGADLPLVDARDRLDLGAVPAEDPLQRQ